ncbi:MULTISPECIES: ABC transporter substrate-binding protein [Pectobacterium]|uniref:Sugar ABC transporter substrate-binding protein n=1 Tax=Pectobacterium aquaticum TaxID=2204145 RepID=A0AA93APV7_9GAMM|nr:MULTISPECIES: sugar ABC transporter substrate-binding protein [Pectobacterium]MBN3062564.1 sugar ABC transporter substrate-binding protein [Pectobacterium aquaticum]RRO24680.1 sugar ABC transporter substrate-binding protein [Pectobacterium aquaticum]WGL27306.1 sugar ABC transporter substrate-binding protein [Pectobacterium brasiliense]
MKKIVAKVVATALLAGSSLAVHAADELNVWIRANNNARVIYEQEAAAFEKQTGIKVSYFSASTDFEQRLARAAVGNTLPDLIINDAAYMGQLIQLNVVDAIEPSQLSYGKDLQPVALNSLKFGDGKYYGIPTSVQASALYIRKDWREKLGLPQPKTWDDLKALAQAFTEKDPDGNGKNDTYGFGLPGSATRGYTSWILSSFIWQAGGEFVSRQGDAFKASLDDKGVVDAVTFMRGMVCDKVVQPGAINAVTSDISNAFRSGQVGMVLSGPYSMPVFSNEPGPDKFEVVKPPRGPVSNASLAEGEAIFLVKSSKQKAQALKFIDFFISQEGQKIGTAVGTPNEPIVRLPVNKTVDANAIYQDQRWGVFAEQYASDGHYVPAVPNWTPIRQVTADGFNKILSNCQSDIPTELKQLNEKVNIELGKQKVLAK